MLVIELLAFALLLRYLLYLHSIYCSNPDSIVTSSLINRTITATTMAIGDIPSSPQQAAAPPQPIDIEAWTEQATVALGSVAISTPGDAVPGTSVTLAIPLDEHDAPSAAVHPVGASAAAKEGGYYRRKEPLRRDSMKRREALLKGKEGSRRRQRWENGTLGLAPPPSLRDALRIATPPLNHRIFCA